jgi:hypothetical protein
MSILISRRPRDEHPEVVAFLYGAGIIAPAAARGDEEAAEVQGEIFASWFPLAGVRAAVVTQQLFLTAITTPTQQAVERFILTDAAGPYRQLLPPPLPRPYPNRYLTLSLHGCPGSGGGWFVQAEHDLDDP